MTTQIPRRKRLSGEERLKFSQEVADLYVGGSSISEIAGRTGRSYGAIHRLLKENETVTLRSTGGGKAGPRGPRTR